MGMFDRVIVSKEIELPYLGDRKTDTLFQTKEGYYSDDFPRPSLATYRISEEGKLYRLGYKCELFDYTGRMEFHNALGLLVPSLKWVNVAAIDLGEPYPDTGDKIQRKGRFVYIAQFEGGEMYKVYRIDHTRETRTG